VFTYRVDGDLRFISHHDTMRLFQRAIARAALPVRYTEGFNPHARLSLPLPRPVGVASDAEALVVEFEAPVEGADVLDRLNRQVPAGLELTQARRLAVGERPRPVWVRYRLEIDQAALENARQRVQELLQQQAAPIARTDATGGETRTIDAKPYLEGMRIAGNSVEFSLRITDSGTIKPAEVAGLLGYDVRSINHRIRRLEIQWQ